MGECRKKRTKSRCDLVKVFINIRNFAVLMVQYILVHIISSGSAVQLFDFTLIRLDYDAPVHITILVMICSRACF